MIGRRSLIGLAIAAAGMTFAAAAVHLGRPGLAAVRTGEPALPALAERANDAARLAVSVGETRFTVARGAAEGNAPVWTLVERDSYPVRPQVVRNVLIGLAELRLSEPRTARSELYGRIDVMDADAPGARALLVAATDPAGAELGALLIGKQREGQMGTAGQAHYVRRPGEAQSWLATGTLEIPRDPIEWLDRSIANIPRQRVREVAITGVDRPPLRIVRDGPETAEFRIADLPVERQVDRQFRVDSLATALENLELIDVRSAAGLDFPAEGPRAVFTTFDGLTVTARLTVPEPSESDAESAAVWVAFEAIHTPPEHPPAADPAPDAASPGDNGQTEGQQSTEPAVQEAAALNARLSGWAYRLPPFKIDRLRSRIEDITEAVPATGPAAADQTPAPALGPDAPPAE